MSDELPKGWNTAPVSEVIEDFQPGFASGEKNVEGGVAHLRMNNIGLDGELVLDLIRTVPENLAKPRHDLLPGDVLVCTTNSGVLVGKCAYFDLKGRYAFSNHLTRLRPKCNVIDGRFLRWNLWLHWKRGVFDDKCKHWVNQSSLPKDALLEDEIVVPPLAEQRRIMAKVEKLLGQVDACQQRLEKMPKLLKRFRQSVLAAACSGRLTADWREENPKATPVAFGDTSDDLPNSWRELSLSEVARVSSGEAFKKSEYAPSGAKLLQIANVSFGKIIWEQQNFLPLSYLKSHADLVLKEGDILMALNRPLLNWRIKIARVTKADLPAILYQRVGRFFFIRGERSINEEFFFLFMQSFEFIHELNERLRGTDQPYVNPPEMLEILFPVPPLPEQQEIVRRVEGLFALANQLEARLAKARGQVAKLTPSLLARAFAGQLVPQDPTDEPAEKMLRRIKTSRNDQKNGRNHGA